jgi:hypothetical protein
MRFVVLNSWYSCRSLRMIKKIYDLDYKQRATNLTVTSGVHSYNLQQCFQIYEFISAVCVEGERRFLAI